MANQIKAGIVLTYTALFLNCAIGLVYTPFLTRMLGQEEYGLYSLVYSLVTSLVVLDFGFGNALVRYTAKYRAEGQEQKLREIFGMFFLIFCFIALLTLGAGAVLYFNTENLFSRSMSEAEIGKMKVMMILMTFNLAFTFVMSVHRSIVVAYEKFIFQKTVYLLRIVLSPLVIVIFLLLGYKAITMVVLQTIFNVLTLSANWVYCKKKLKIRFSFSNFDKGLFKEIFFYSFWIFLNLLMDRLYWNIGSGVLGVYCGAKVVAVYGIAIQLQQLYVSFSTAIQGPLLPKVTSMVTVGGNDKQVSDLFVRTGRLQFVILGLLLSGFTVFGRQFVNLWVGQSYGQVYQICLMFFIPLLVNLIQNVGINILQARNQMRFSCIVYVIIGLLAFIASIPLTKSYGAVGTAAATMAALVLGQIIIMNIYYQKRVGLDIVRFWREIVKMSLAPFALTLLSLWVVSFFSIENFFQLVVAILLFGLIYVAVMWFFSLNAYEKELFGGMVSKLLGKAKNKTPN